MNSLILEIQRDCIDPSISTLVIMRKLQAAAVKLDLSEISEWLKNETEGYARKFEDLPPARQLRGTPKALNPYHGWQPIFTGSGQIAVEIADKISRVPVRQPVAEIEHLLNNDTGGELFFQYPPHQEATVLKAIGKKLTVGVFVSSSSMNRVIEDVRSRCLTLALALEKRGIFGENMSFSNEDKSRASSVTFNVNAQSVGNISNASDFASVQNNGAGAFACSPERVETLVQQIRASGAGLPDSQRPRIIELADQLKEHKNNPEKITGILESMKRVCEAAAGNITAHGLLELLKSL